MESYKKLLAKTDEMVKAKFVEMFGLCEHKKLAEITGIDPRTILKIEKNFTVPKVDTYAKLVIGLELTNEEIGEEIRKIIIK